MPVHLAVRPRRGGERPPSLEEAMAAGGSEVILGGGDATKWLHLEAYLKASAEAPAPRRVWVECEAGSLASARIEGLASLGAHGLIVRAEAGGAALRLEPPGKEGGLGRAEALGLKVRVRLLAGPRAFSMVVPIARRLAPRQVILCLSRRDGERMVRLRPEAVAHAFLGAPRLTFENHDDPTRGYLPPCALPDLWRARPGIWSTLLASEADEENGAFDACGSCDVRARCRYSDAGALGPAARRALVPVSGSGGGRSSRRRPVPERIRRLRRGPEIPCIAPWTVMEIVDPAGLTNHCCMDWTVGARGNARVRSLTDLWNGPGYRAARRRMLGRDEGPLCRAICPRLHDRRFAEHDLEIIERSPPFVENQLRLAEDLALRRDVVRAGPLYMTLCPTTYCNYDCIMCAYGRLPRRDLPDEVLEQVEDYLPTLRTLTLLGGEPLASPAVMRLLSRFDRDSYPDGGVDMVTNGSLLTRRVLEKLGACAFGAIVVSLNAATSKTYAKVHGGASLSTVLENIDALIAHREKHGHFGMTLSFVVQPAASGDLLRFGEIAAARGLDMRLLPLTPSSRDLDFYGDPETVERVLDDVGSFLSWAEENRPTWKKEIEATRGAIEREAARRRARSRSEAEAASSAGLAALYGACAPGGSAGHAL